MRNALGMLSAALLTCLLGAAPVYADAESEYLLAVRYLQGDGAGTSDAQVFEHLHRASEQGHVKAQFRLGEMYLLGRGTLKDYRKAFAWWERAASGGYPTAQYRVGLFFETGYQGVVERNPAKAREWYTRAAAQGYAVAVTRLHNLGGPGSVASSNQH